VGTATGGGAIDFLLTYAAPRWVDE
jgi:hypothetical protein